MNALTHKPRWYASNLRWYVLIAVVPVMLGLIATAYWGTQEWLASRANQTQIENWAREGTPYNNVSLKEWYTKRTFAEGTEDWLTVLDLCTWGTGAKSAEKLPYLGADGKELSELIPGCPWPEEALVGDYLKEMEPAIRLIEKACQYPTPVRLPVAFDGFGTLLEYQQNSRSVMRLLNLDFDYAYHQRDTKRAMRDLKLMQATAKAFDSRETIVSELVNVALRGMSQVSIRRSLTESIWSDDELALLRSLLSSEETFGERWKDMMQGERAFGLAGVANIRARGGLNEPGFELNNALHPLMPSGEKTLIDFYTRAASLPNTNLKGKRSWSYALSDEHGRASKGSAGVWLDMLMPGIESVMQAEIYAEESQRWVRTAVALRQYKNKQEKWPARLRDLELLGLTVEDYSNAEQEVFGYEVDGDTAYLWTTPHSPSRGKYHVHPTRPKAESEYANAAQSGEDSLYYVLKLR